MKKKIWLLLCGMVFGIANGIPGVSGGTMAVVMGVYDDLIDAIGNFRKEWKKSLQFLVPFLIGTGVALIAFARVIELLIERFPMQLNFFFIGLIIGCIPLIGKKAFSGRIKPAGVLAFLAACGVMVATIFVSEGDSGNIIRTLTVSNVFRFFMGGFVAAIAMIIPGISGSMMLVVMGIYWSAIAAINDLNIPIILAVGLGIVAGIFLGAKLISICLSHFPGVTYCAILGLIIGSLVVMFHASGFAFSGTGIVSILLLLAGAALAFLLSRDKKGIDKSRSGSEKALE